MSSGHNADYWSDTDSAVKRTTLMDRFAAKVARVFEAVEDRLDHSINQHLERAIPRQSTSPESLALVPAVERVGTFDCCACCKDYIPQPCPDIHRDPCDKCGQTWPSGGVA
jgi:hypothetical protein